MFDIIGLVQLERLSGEYLDLSSWWSRFSAKISVSGRIYLLEDMTTDANRATRPKTLGITFIFL